MVDAINWWALAGAALVLGALGALIWDLGIGTEPIEATDPITCPHADTTYSFTTGVTRCMECGEITEQEFWD